MSVDNAKKWILAFLLPMVRNFLIDVANNLWDGLWEEIIKAVAVAEQKWEESGKGAEKKEWAINQIMTYINEKANLNWFQKQIVKIFVNQVIDAIVESMNEQLGSDWGAKVRELEEELAGKIPFID